MQVWRRIYRSPYLLALFGALFCVVSFFFLDRYIPAYGVIWNAVNGTIQGIPYHWFLAVGAATICLGVAAATGKDQR